MVKASNTFLDFEPPSTANADAYHLRAIAEYLATAADLSRNDFIKCLDMGANQHALMHQALLQLSLRDVQSASESLKSAIDESPDKLYATLHYNMGCLLLISHQGEEAAEYFRRTLEVDADYIEAKYNLAMSLVRRFGFCR